MGKEGGGGREEGRVTSGMVCDVDFRGTLSWTFSVYPDYLFIFPSTVRSIHAWF